jgi:hypothetical protein
MQPYYLHQILVVQSVLFSDFRETSTVISDLTKTNLCCQISRKSVQIFLSHGQANVQLHYLYQIVVTQSVLFADFRETSTVMTELN